MKSLSYQKYGSLTISDAKEGSLWGLGRPEKIRGQKIIKFAVIFSEKLVYVQNYKFADREKPVMIL